MILSEFLGYTSIACWLGAQFPQVLENYRRRSCEGIALPFLANWFLGDVSNLIGCLLTHQLPFQTYLATYFVFIDLVLVIQYFYYRNSKPLLSGHGRARASSTIRRASMDRGSHYRTLSVAAANVAAAAALAAQQDEQTDSRYTSRRWDMSSSRDNIRDDAEVDEDAMAALSDSMVSENGTRVKHVSWSTERTNVPGPSRARSAFISSAHATTESPVDFTYARGRTPIRDSVDDTDPPDSATIRRSSRASKRGAGMVLLGVWALFGLGHFANGPQPRSLISTSVGKVLVNRGPVALYFPSPAFTHSPSISPRTDDHHPKEGTDNPSNERLIGRVFAWVCTLLYFTSRLPQIWKNFARKSVEGLSMYLFVFAFLGNVFYVSSILLSPQVFAGPPVSTAFIRESIPYLIGSGGTLVFDITIVAQSFVYRPKRGRTSRSRRSASRAMEEEALISAGAAESAFEASTESTRPRTASWNRTS